MDNSKWVHVALFGGNYGATRQWHFGSSIDGSTDAEVINYADNTWYRLRIEALTGSLRVSIVNDDGSPIVSHMFTHDLASLGSDFRVAVAQYVLRPTFPLNTDGAVDYIRALPTLVSVESSAPSLDSNGLTAYPNPFEHATGVMFSIAAGEDVDVRVYDARGGLVRSLHSGRMARGAHYVPWDGFDANGLRASTGIYFIRARSTERTLSTQVVRVK